MEHETDFQIKSCIDWKTKLPSSSAPRTSPTFSLLGSEWCLRLSCSSGAMIRNSGYTVYLIPKNMNWMHQPEDALEKPFSVATYTRHPRDASGGPVRWTWQEIPRRTRAVLWETGRPPHDISVKLDWVRELQEMRFVCQFYGAQPYGNQIQSEVTFNRWKEEYDKLEVNQSRSLCPNRTGEKSVQVASEVPRDIESLSSDFSHLLEKEILPDVKLECGGRTFQAHRSVLAARSQVFRAMFQNETLESETGAVKILDMDVDVLEKLLKFVYTGKPEDLSEGTTADLYEAADKYDVLSLKTACSYWIVRNLTVENCVKYLRVSDSHSDHDLKCAVISFITENPSVLKSESWLALSRELPVLANEVFQTYVASTVQ